MVATIYGNEVIVQVNSVIKPDDWQFAERLIHSDWAAASHRLLTGHNYGITSLAVNVKVTGRTWQRREGDYWARVEIEFVGDCEPSVFCGGWIKREW